MAYMQKITYQTRKITKAFGDGINVGLQPFDIGDTELTYVRNLSGKKYPAASVRDGRQSAYSAITTPNALGQRNNQYPHVLDGITWKRWDGLAWQTVQAGLTSATGKIIEFATGTTLFTILINGTDRYSWDGTTAVSLTAAPQTKLYAVHKGRVYALIGKELKFSALNLITDWTTVNDSGSISVTNMQGDGTAICEFADHIIVFSEQSMHELYGTGPINYRLPDVSYSDGCISDRTVKECNGVLYFLDNLALKAYTGGKPSIASDKVKSYIEGINQAYKSNCAAGVRGDSYYLSIPYGSSTTNNLLLEMDTSKLKQGIINWFVHTGNIAEFVNIGEKLYGVDYSGNFFNMESGTTDNGTAISWELISKAFNDGVVSQKKELQEMNITADLPTGSTLNVYYSRSTDKDDFVLLKTFTTSSNTQNLNALFPVMLPFDWYRLKLSGTGPCTLHNIEIILRVRPR